MAKERRRAIPPRRYEMLGELTDQQRFRLRNYERFGFQLQFVRHPVFDHPFPVLHDPATNRYALLEADGSLDYNHHLTVREPES